MVRRFKNAIIAVIRFWLSLRRPSTRANAARMAERGETTSSFRVRAATADDIPQLVRLHLETWRDTYRGMVSRKTLDTPTWDSRERQWRSAFTANRDRRWFCLVVEGADGTLIGFATAGSCDHPQFPAEISKIYLRREYQRLGLGRRLLGSAARRFLSAGITSMLLFSDPRNPSCAFYEALEAELVVTADGEKSYGCYGWRDLERLSQICSSAE